MLICPSPRTLLFSARISNWFKLLLLREKNRSSCQSSVSNDSGKGVNGVWEGRGQVIVPLTVKQPSWCPTLLQTQGTASRVLTENFLFQTRVIAKPAPAGCCLPTEGSGAAPPQFMASSGWALNWTRDGSGASDGFPEEQQEQAGRGAKTSKMKS